MKISRKARDQYQFEDFKFSERGNISFGGDVYSIRLFVQKVNQRKNLVNFPELAIKIGQFNAVALISEINNYIIESYTNLQEKPAFLEKLSKDLIEKIGLEKLNKATSVLLEEFPPESVYKEEIDIEEYLKKNASDEKNKENFLNEFINLWFQNNNPAFSPYIEFFDDTNLEKNTVYKEIVDDIVDYFEKEIIIESKNQNLIDFLMEPFIKHPYSIKAQLEYIQEHWSDILGDYSYRILLALDLIREEEMMRGLGPGESKVLEYDLFESENFTPDKDWMPKVVMIAKNIYVWLDQLSKYYNRSIRKIHEIPDEELIKLKNWGFNAIWIIGIWERSQASKTIKRWCGNPEAEASAYSIYDYTVSQDLGGLDSFNDLKKRAWSKGIRLASDMVPNHTGVVSKWIMEHPDWYISLLYPPFPSYTYSGENLSGDSNIGIFIEDKYFSRTDAAVTFKRIDHNNGDIRYIYHGNDGTSFPWNDTAQLNFLNSEVRKNIIKKIVEVSRMFPIIRFDAAMTLTRKHFQRLWFPEPGTGGAIPSRAEHGMTREEFLNVFPEEFWREVVEAINRENPDTLLLAEAFWLLEGFFVRTLGMHRVYNSAFMNMLRDEDNMKYRAVMKNTLEFDPEILKRFVNFMNNPDEETAIKQFGDGDKYFGICGMMVTMPGLPMFGHGQIEGFYEKYGMEYRKAYWDENVNLGLLYHHERTIFPMMKKRSLFADVKNFFLYDFWEGNIVNEDVFAYSNKLNDERGLVIYHNKYAETKGFIKNSVGFAKKIGDDKIIVQKTLAEGLGLPKEGYCIFKDYISGLEYIRRNREINEMGLYVELHAYQLFVFMEFRIIQDNRFFHYAQLFDFLGGKGVPNIDETLKDVIYRPIHQPIEEIINIEIYKNLLNNLQREKVYLQLDKSLIELLNMVKKYSKGNETIEIVKNLILNKLKRSLDYRNELIKLNIDKNLRLSLEKLLPKSSYEWGILISWELIHLLGRIVSKSNYELRSRSWLDEWRLTKYIQVVLQNLATEESESPFESILLIKLLITHQNWAESDKEKEPEEKESLINVLIDPEVQQYLNFNRYQDILWYNAESYEKLVRWLSIIKFVNTLGSMKNNIKTQIEEILKKYNHYLEASQNSNFKVENLISKLS
jgi:glycosidase